MGPRWKGKDSEAKAFKDPMSKIVWELQSSLIQSESQGLLCGCSVLLAAEAEQAVLLNRACFGEPISAAEKDKQWFQLGLEEAFYLCYSLKCLNIVGEDKCLMNVEEFWLLMKSRKAIFPDFYKGYSHLRMKNWVVKSGSRYGVDFVAYRHHPALVHSEFAVLVSTEGGGDVNGRLRMWSDVHCTTRLCGGVVKTLLVLNINKNGQGAFSPSCIEKYTVDERTVRRWNPEKCREDHTVVESETNNHTVIENGTKGEFII
ncbi:tRNA-splicing endonuclease subunit Sen2-1 [Ziziphus jujuba]|uniref:tRNA-intron lyase n=1 Tax=Ziziphus jujuba TaxID=326968 RepID=A0A6P3ZXT4_ZIZJJ|nr:tRNA-splicing endonuclease subunit Sen2-1 [Ziziphus jujuba]XP_048334029.2 tRNA-splicing endonuclease subunit Sen2-1 [Ziziphus jujuba]XP_048334030.2 tRNA-splicing endonuclease subunit Sen2-1 [Ziziphus jujuba]XP_060671849.1 tRNA-splicing endonuclease subunit Sen2-1 [Ziziphus jujuba]XP_060671850.1 tRNA-splicing endonuclease subunit Sen2-1 [Ziziphus jujuba]XP_060671851.1 tRNA-splicing endonuclease subunit Sen2-1 [Ziziphus jujuba]XP_060671852.1 tRNA-splicing endonuclease subunit Sen2-1 [Ziziphu